jgi:hypothetical protein
MLARFGVGAGVAAIPAAAAITGAAAGWLAFVVVTFAVLALLAIVVVPVAPYVRGLNRVPLIGSSRFDVVLRMNGQLLDGSRVSINDWANTSVVEVGIKNLSRAVTVRDAWMNFLIPSGIRMERCDKVGVPIEDEGRWEPFHSHPLGKHSRSDYWNARGWAFESGLSHVLRFKVRFSPSDSGEYPVLFKLGAPSLYSTIEVEGTITVESIPGVELGPEDQMGALITESEQVYRKWADSPTPCATSFRTEVGDVVAGASPILSDALDGDLLPQLPASEDGSGLLVPLRDTLDALYVVRDEVGRGEPASPDLAPDAGPPTPSN